LNDIKQSKALVLNVIDRADANQRRDLLEWSQSLLDIRNSSLSKIEKTKKALFATQHRKVILPIIKILGRQIKAHGWDNRSNKGRWGIIGASVGVAAFSGQSAGIAALGGGIGVPLWIVFGAGGSFVCMLIEELKKREASSSAPHQDGVTFIEAQEIIDEISHEEKI